MSELIGPLKASLGRLKSIYGEDFHKKGPLFATPKGEQFGECFSLPKQFTPELGNTKTGQWVQGESFFNLNGTQREAFYNPLYFFGSAIATFDENGKVYIKSEANPRSTHGAIYLFSGYEEINKVKVPGLWVIDQWLGRGHSGIRFIRVQGAQYRSNDARAFSVVMLNK